MLYQWKDEFYKLYPDANILVADKTDFTKQNRERLFGRIATGDWDAVIVAHSSFKKIDMPRDVQEEILREQIDAVIEAIEASKAAEGGRATIKQLEKQREKMEERYNALLAGTGQKDRAVDFADLGVDALFIDESHEFKNLAFQTTMNVSGLGNVTGSAKALDLFIKCRYLQRKNNGRGVYFMTGTPISNTIAEVYTLQRYMQYDDLKDKDIEHFDAWASTFGQVTSGWELDATGVNYKLKSRFAKFQNVPELLSMYRTFADVVTKSDLDEQAKQAGERPLTPPIEGGKPFNDVVERSPAQATYMESIIERMEHLPKDPRIDNPLKVTNDARKAGLDYRLIEPTADDFEGSKLNAAVERIYEIWHKTSADKGTQLVFCDLSTPKGGKAPASAQSERQDLESGALIDVDDTLVRETPEQEDMAEDDEDDALAGVVNMDEVIAMSSGKFSVYDDMKQKLMAKGISADEIAFIHDANTDIRKAKLFSDMNTGRVRVLLGSTAKMGAGMNVQKRLVAAHHLDAPWRPSDLEQRNGRIIRQGNMFYERNPDTFTVKIFNYATKMTYDARIMLHRTYFSEHVGSLGQGMYEDGQWHSTSSAPRGVYLKKFKSAEEALGIAREDAARRGLKETPPAETGAAVSALDGETFRERIGKAGFHPTGSDFYGKNEHSKTMDAGDGGIFQMRIFQTADNQTGLHVQYEKYNMIDGSRMVDAQFGTLDEALEFVGAYQAPVERPAAPMPEETHVRGMVFSSRPRMR